MSKVPAIFALSSGQGPAGVAVIRISGDDAYRVAEALTGPLPRERGLWLRSLRVIGEPQPIDRALVLTFPGPRSFTGEDVVELHAHGGRAVVAAIIEALGRNTGARPAEPGEFTRRAFQNGKLDLTEAEGLADLIAAETEAQRRQAMAQSTGTLRRLYEGWRRQLIQALALVEAELDFADEADVPGSIAAQARPIVENLCKAMRAHLDDANRGEILRDGFRIAIAGPPNAGKSSLLNALARRDVAIVSPLAGTTRDVIEVKLDLGGQAVIISDTAGVRPPEGEIEREGIRRSFEAARAADLVLWLSESGPPPAGPPTAFAAEQVWHVISKVDLTPIPKERAESFIAISARTGEGLPQLVARIAEAARARTGTSEGAVITRSRHRIGVSVALAALDDYEASPSNSPELGAEDLRRAAHALGRICGRVDVEDVLDAIFGSFCIGK